MTLSSHLDELERVARAATPGPWTECQNMAGPISVVVQRDGYTRVCWIEITGKEQSDATYIATFDPPTILALIAEVRTLIGEKTDG